MKIVFSTISGIDQHELKIDATTTLGEVKRFYEAKKHLKRSAYVFKHIINPDTFASIYGFINADSTMPFVVYLKTVLGFEDIGDEIKLYSHCIYGDDFAEIPVLERENLAKNAALIKELPEGKQLYCGLTHEIITKLPVKINNQFYSFQAFINYLTDIGKLFIENYRSGNTYEFKCPSGNKLPDELEKCIRSFCLSANYNSHLELVLFKFFSDSIDEFDTLAQNLLTACLHASQIEIEKNATKLAELLTTTDSLFATKGIPDEIAANIAAYTKGSVHSFSEAQTIARAQFPKIPKPTPAG